jgi:hypothetical protein
LGGQRLGPSLGRLGQPSLLEHPETDVADRVDSVGSVLGLTASKIVSTMGEGTVVDILLGMVGALTGRLGFHVFGRWRDDWFQHRHRS